MRCPKEINIYMVKRQNGGPIMFPVRKRGLSCFMEQLLHGKKMLNYFKEQFFKKVNS
jgi:hypothetical protein